MKKKRTEITVETHRVLVIRQHQRTVLAKCSECAEAVRMVTAEQAAALTRVSVRTICRRVESGTLHFKEFSDGSLLVCLNSLLEQNRRQKQY